MKTILWAIGGLMLVVPMVGGCGSGGGTGPPSGTPASRQGAVTLEQSQAIAVEFIKNAPTFKWDGMPETLKLDGSSPGAEANTWILVYAFESRHGGYGDRTGQIVTQAITPHTVRLVVRDGKVVEATLDGRWDEIGQKPVG
ncbi:MAG: hypothetical protein HYX92_15095 [Chloroflexi bacterium]|nr:hypothetical protein [Chloroflexota bacterium]